MPSREWSSVRIAMPKPSPTAPITSSSATSTSSNTSWPVGEPRMPILCSSDATEKPGASAGTENAVTRWDARAEGSVAAKTV